MASFTSSWGHGRVAAACLVVIASVAPPVSAASFVVDSTSDAVLGACTAAPGDCSLRGAITAANGLAGADLVTFDIPGTEPNCTASNACTIILGSRLPTISDVITVDGSTNGASITINANNSAAIIQSFFTTVTMRKLTLMGGNTASDGGAILGQGDWTIVDCTITSNRADNGGGIYMSQFGSKLTLINSTISGNTATNSGGGIMTDLAELTVINSTIQGNQSMNFGAGIRHAGFAVSVINSTIAGNEAASGTSGLANQAGLNMTVINSLLVNNLGGNCSGTMVGHHNISTDNTCNAVATMQSAVQIGLGALANNGGPTQTMALALESSAKEAGDNGVCAAAFASNGAGGIDQRGVARPIGPNCDVGAFEGEALVIFASGFE